MKYIDLYSCLKRGNDIRVMECVDALFTEGKGKDSCLELSRTIGSLIGYVRDPVQGMGERDLTYVLICTLYKYDPVQAMYALRMITEKVDGSGPIGSWADTKHFCEYVRKSHFVLQADKDVMINTAIGLLIHQLNKDRGAWNLAMAKYLQIKRVDPNTLVERPVGRDVMSLAAKWAPREKSKYGWIFSRMIGGIRARDFRRMLSALNRELDTVQIKQCAGRWAEIEPDSVSITTMLKQRRAFLRGGCEDRIKCAENFKEIGLGLGPGPGPGPIKTQICDLVKHAFARDRDADWLNSQWASIVGERIGTKRTSIPIIDISWDLATDKRCGFIGNGILIAQRYLERLMLADHTPVWIEALHGDKFTDIIDRIRPFVDRATDSSLSRAFNMIRESFHMTKTSPDSIVFHVFSDQHHPNPVEYNVVYNGMMDFIHMSKYKIMCLQGYCSQEGDLTRIS